MWVKGMTGLGQWVKRNLAVSILEHYVGQMPLFGVFKLFDLLVPTCPLTSIKTWEADARKMVWISGATEESLGSGVLWETSNDGRTQPTNNATTGNLQLNFINWVGIWKSKDPDLNFTLWSRASLRLVEEDQSNMFFSEGVYWLFNPLLLFLFSQIFHLFLCECI